MLPKYGGQPITPKMAYRGLVRFPSAEKMVPGPAGQCKIGLRQSRYPRVSNCVSRCTPRRLLSLEPCRREESHEHRVANAMVGQQKTYDRPRKPSSGLRVRDIGWRSRGGFNTSDGTLKVVFGLLRGCDDTLVLALAGTEFSLR